MIIPATSQFLKNRSGKALLLIGALGVLLAWFFLSQASQSTTAVIRLHQLAVKKELLRRENAQILYQISLLESSTYLRVQAQKQGFVAPEITEYLPFDTGSGLPADLPVDGESAPLSISNSQSTLFDWIISHLLILIVGESSAAANP